MNKRPSKKGFYSAAVGTLFVALCCFTPILVIALITIGLGTFTPYLDYILFPALAVMGVMSFLAYRKYKNDCDACDITNNESSINV